MLDTLVAKNRFWRVGGRYRLPRRAVRSGPIDGRVMLLMGVILTTALSSTLAQAASVASFIPGRAPCNGTCSLEWAVEQAGVPPGDPVNVAVPPGSLIHWMSYAIGNKPRSKWQSMIVGTEGALSGQGYWVRHSGKRMLFVRLDACENWALIEPADVPSATHDPDTDTTPSSSATISRGPGIGGSNGSGVASGGGDGSSGASSAPSGGSSVNSGGADIASGGSGGSSGASSVPSGGSGVASGRSVGRSGASSVPSGGSGAASGRSVGRSGASSVPSGGSGVLSSSSSARSAGIGILSGGNSLLSGGNGLLSGGSGVFSGFSGPAVQNRSPASPTIISTGFNIGGTDAISFLSVGGGPVVPNALSTPGTITSAMTQGAPPQIPAVPLPASLLLILTGVGCLFLARRRAT